MIIFTDRKSAEMPLENVVEKCIEKYSPKAIYLREKDLNCDDYQMLANKIIPICKQNGVDFYVCEKVDVARNLGVKNLHISLNNLSKIGTTDNFEKLSVSVHSAEDVRLASSFGATCLVFGHIFETECKKGLPPRGLEKLSEICSISSLPVVAIGGITSKNFHEVIKVGTSDFAVMSSAMKLNF